MPITIKYIGYTPFILVASPSKDTDDEWVRSGRPRATLPGPVHKDYALMKVLYMLRQEDKTLRIQSFKWEATLVPVDFSGLRDSDIIYIVGHGDDFGVYAMGPDAKRNQDRLVETLTKDGNLKAKREGKEVIICLLSCRAGLALHKLIARKLFNQLGGTIDVKVAGAKGFTFGSMRTSSDQQNEVLIKGIPWRMEYLTSITKDDADKETSAREKKTITYDGKKREIEAFQDESGKLVKHFKDVIKKLTSTEVNNALNELQDGSDRDWWLTLVWQQQQLYANAKTNSNLEFDMWYADLTEAYAVANGRGITDHDVASILARVTFASGVGLTSIK